MNEEKQKLQKALEVIIKATITKRLRWERSIAPKPVDRGIAGAFDSDLDEIRDYYEANFADLHCTIFRTVPTGIAKGLFALNSRQERGEITLKLEDIKTRESWTVPSSHRLEELMEAVRQASAQEPPPPNVIDRILSAAGAY
jgi:hypothetical protein